MSREPTSFAYRCNGGSLSPDDPTYITRPADRKFYNSLKQGGLCYVLNSRQMGKSSLVNKTMYELQKEGIACTSIDLSSIIGKNTADEQFYADLMRELNSGFQLQVNRREFRKRHSDLSPRQRFCVFVEEVLLVCVREPMVVFIDEIDSLLRLKSLEEIDDFLSIIRFFYNQRSVKNAYQNLNFALLGVATPYDLIQNKIAIPFNIGQVIEIELAGFTLEEAEPLARGLTKIASDPTAVLQEILSWTGGQPFLTQKLCWLVANSEEWIAFGDEARRVKQIAKDGIINDWDRKDEPVHLRTIRDRLLNGAFESRLKQYQKVLRRKQICHKTLPVYEELWLSGIVAKNKGKLRVYNRIYQEVFNAEWVKEQLQPDPHIGVLMALATSVAVTAVVVGARSLGLLQGWELKAFDGLLQLRPNEEIDERLLVVEVTEEDIRQYKHPLSDRVLAQLIEKLEQNRPRVIGLDIYRERNINYINSPIPPADTDFPTHARENELLIPVCKVSSESDSGIGHLPGIPDGQLGFTNFVEDRDRVLRRHLLFQTPPPNSPCKTYYSFSLQLAFRYLGAKKIVPEFTPKDDLKLGKIVFADLPARAGGYQRYDPGGQQVLLNYRASERIARSVTLSEVLTGKVDPDWVRDRIVLIGVTATSIKDNFQTPYGQQRGLFVHAEMTSQILSAVLDGRSLIRPLPQWVDGLWIWGISAAGVVIFGFWRSPLSRTVGGGLTFGMLLGLSYVSLLQGHWFPIVPCAISLAASGSIVAIELHWQTRRSRVSR